MGGSCFFGRGKDFSYLNSFYTICFLRIRKRKPGKLASLHRANIHSHSLCVKRGKKMKQFNNPAVVRLIKPGLSFSVLCCLLKSNLPEVQIFITAGIKVMKFLCFGVIYFIGFHVINQIRFLIINFFGRKFKGHTYFLINH